MRLCFFCAIFTWALWLTADECSCRCKAMWWCKVLQKMRPRMLRLRGCYTYWNKIISVRQSTVQHVEILYVQQGQLVPPELIRLEFRGLSFVCVGFEHTYKMHAKYLMYCPFNQIVHPIENEIGDDRVRVHCVHRWLPMLQFRHHHRNHATLSRGDLSWKNKKQLWHRISPNCWCLATIKMPSPTECVNLISNRTWQPFWKSRSCNHDTISFFFVWKNSENVRGVFEFFLGVGAWGFVCFWSFIFHLFIFIFIHFIYIHL